MQHVVDGLFYLFIEIYLYRVYTFSKILLLQYGLVYTILYNTIQYNTIQYNTIQYYTILYYTILYYTILYYTILYYTILYYTILYYTLRTSAKASSVTKSGSDKRVGLFVTRLHPDTTDLELNAHIQKATNLRLRTQKLKAKFTSYASFFFWINMSTLYRACKSRGETMRDFRLPEPFDYRSDILTLKSLFRKSSLCLRTP